MIWTVKAEEAAINDLDIDDDDLIESLRAAFNEERDSAVMQVRAARKQLKEQRGRQP